MQKEVGGLREKVGTLDAAASAQLREMNSDWPHDRAGQAAVLSNLYLMFAYLGRWSEQLDELTFKLSSN